jgi:Putative Ig domain
MRRLTTLAVVIAALPWIATAQVSITTTSLPDATAYQAYLSQIQTSGGSGQFFWSVTTGSLPPGILLDASGGLLAGTPSGAAASYAFTVQVLDQTTGLAASRAFTLNVLGLAITTSSLPNATVNQPYSFQLQAVQPGVLNPVLEWSVPVGSQLPAGFSLAANGLLTGTGLNPGSFQVPVEVDNFQYEVGTSRVLTLLVTLGPLGINDVVLPTATQNVQYTFGLVAHGGIPPYTWSFGSANTQGLTIGANSGVISGTPTIPGTFPIPVVLKDSIGGVFSQTFSLNVGKAVSITKTSLANGPAGVFYSDTLTAIDGVLFYRWTLFSGSLPPGLTLTTLSGLISGTPTTEGTYKFAVQVTDFAGGSATQAYTIVIGPVLAITTLSLPDGVLGGAYSQTLAVTNGIPNYTWSIASGALPGGLQLNSATGLISGTPTSAGTFTFDVSVTDTAKTVAHRTLSIKIPLLISPDILSGAVLSAFSQTVTATGGKSPYTWSSGPLPVGLQLNSATGVVSGTPGVGGTSQVAFTVTDVNGLTGTKSITITILQPPAPGTTIGVGTTTQPSVSLTTSAPYDSEITGFLTVVFTPAAGVVGTDEMVRFAPVGGSKLEYIVRANATQAIFPTVSNGTPAIITGTVAGTITLTASMSAGGQDITPSPAPTKTIVIDPAVPVITSVTLQQVTGGLTVVVSGYSNTREVSSGSFTFAVTSGNTLQTAQLTVQLTSAFGTWFNNTGSNATGGQFKLTVPFSVTQGAATAITKVTVTLTNSKGASAAVSSP